MSQTEFTIRTKGAGLYEFTRDVVRWTEQSGRASGLLTLFVRHTSCSLLVQENADADVQRDLLAFFARLVPPGTDPSMSAHIKAAMLPVSLSIPVTDGRPLLGTWQGIYLFEHRTAPHHRRIAAHIG